MYNIFQVQHSIKLFEERDNWGYDYDTHAITILDLLQTTEKNIEDITFDDIAEHFFTNIFCKY